MEAWADTRLVSLGAVSEQLGIGVRVLRHAIREGRLRAHRLGRSWFVRGDDLRSWLEATASTPGAMRPGLLARLQHLLEEARLRSAMAGEADPALDVALELLEEERAERIAASP